jgi:hypothetical protein
LDLALDEGKEFRAVGFLQVGSNPDQEPIVVLDTRGSNGTDSGSRTNRYPLGEKP